MLSAFSTRQRTPLFLFGFILFGFVLISLYSGCSHLGKKEKSSSDTVTVGQSLLPGETFFRSVRQLTSGGTSAEAYWSFDGEWLSFQHQGPGLLNENPACDQIYKIR